MKTEIFLEILLSSMIFGFPRTFPVQMYTRIKRFFKKKNKNTDVTRNADVDYDNPEEVQLENDFQTACQAVAGMNSLSIEQSLTFYALYKQTLSGDCNKPKPNGSDLADLKKWEAWNDARGLTKIQAKTEYINIVESLKPGFRADSKNKVKKELDDDDIFMTDEEYYLRKGQDKDSGKQNLGLTFSRPVMGGDLGEIREKRDEEDDVQSFFNLIDEENLEELKNMILSGYDLTKENGAGMKAIHYAIENEKDEVIELLCEHYEDLDIGDEAGMTPLHYAVTHENETAIELLLKKHVDINKTDDDGESPMDIATNRIKKLIEGHLQV